MYLLVIQDLLLLPTWSSPQKDSHESHCNMSCICLICSEVGYRSDILLFLALWWPLIWLNTALIYGKPCPIGTWVTHCCLSEFLLRSTSPLECLRAVQGFCFCMYLQRTQQSENAAHVSTKLVPGLFLCCRSESEVRILLYLLPSLERQRILKVKMYMFVYMSSAFCHYALYTKIWLVPKINTWK